MRWEDDAEAAVEVPGQLRVSYVVYPDNRVVVTHLTVWIDDTDLAVDFLWWEAEREQLRCTRFSNGSPIIGSLNGDHITIPAGADLLGRTYSERGSGRECSGPVRSFEFLTDTPATAVHDPATDSFALRAELETQIDGASVTFSLDVEGNFLNRPPVAILETADPDLLAEGFIAGCPDMGKGKPPIAPANRSEGLLLQLRSASYDPDGFDIEAIGDKSPRFDIRQERWLHSDGGRFRYLGDGPSMGPVLFATDRQHRLLLIAVDRSGSQNRAFCHFQVEAGEGAAE